MPIRVFNVYMEGNPGPLNPAINSYHVANDALTDADVAAQLIGFHVLYAQLVAEPCSISRITSGVVGGPQSDVSFPSAELTAINAAVGAGPYDAPYSDYGAALGTSAAAPLGTSLLVTEYTALGGRHNGRKYLPYLGQLGINTTTGLVEASTIGNVRAYYLYWLLATNPSGGGPATGIPDTLGLVAGSTNSPIGDCKVSAAPARLRSRIR